MLFAAMTLLTGVITAMEKELYKMKIENQLYSKIFLNVPNPSKLTDKPPYPFVKGRKTKKFLLWQEDIANQTIAFPGGQPCNKVQLPIETECTHFIIKHHPEDRQKIILEDATSKKILSEITLQCNPK